jgi:hypothetical protein
VDVSHHRPAFWHAWRADCEGASAEVLEKVASGECAQKIITNLNEVLALKARMRLAADERRLTQIESQTSGNYEPGSGKPLSV